VEGQGGGGVFERVEVVGEGDVVAVEAVEFVLLGINHGD